MTSRHFLLLYSLLFLTLSASVVQGQIKQTDLKTNRDYTWRKIGYFSSVVGSVGGLYLFADEAYYNDRVVSFHWARNSDGRLDWFDNYHRGIDKFGHVFSTSLFSEHLYFQARWSGYSNKQASWLAFGSSLFILGAMEVWDAHFKSWGFSPGDFTANVIGASWPVLQKNINWLNHVDYKLSYDFFAEKSRDPGVHDYEHLTFWLTVNPWPKAVPEWLKVFNLAMGYGLESYASQEQEIYIGLDYRLKQLQPKNKWLKQLVRMLDRFHLPAPAIRIHPDYVAYGFFF